jgi:CheY-like chemotaxis protein
VDDEAANRELLAQILEPAGFKVIMAASGLEGLRLARSGQPDVILLDLMMPGLSGLDVVKALRAEDATRQIPVIVLTAKDMTDTEKMQLNGHVSAMLSRGSTGAVDLLGQVRHMVALQNADK